MTDEKLDQILKQALVPEIDHTEIKVQKRRKDKVRKFDKIKKSIAAAAIVGIVGISGIGGLGYFNPAFAAKIPLIGRIFEKIEDNVTYSGKYMDKTTVLTNEDLAGNLDISKYSVSDRGMILTASEVYCDGYSIFLTVNIKAENTDFTHIPKHYTSKYITDNQTAAGFYISGSWSIDRTTSEQLRNTFEGEVIDDYTFAGMLKIDLTEKFEGSGELCLNINGLGYDDDRMLNSEEISASHWTDGNWNITLPFEVNESDRKTIEVNEKKENITLDYVVVSPYQVMVCTTTPGKQRELTDDRREKLLSENPDLTDAEMFELLGWSYEPCYTVVFNQDGEILYPDIEITGNARFAVQGKEIKTLHIFIFHNLDNAVQMEEEGINSKIAEKAIIAKEIYVE